MIDLILMLLFAISFYCAGKYKERARHSRLVETKRLELLTVRDRRNRRTSGRQDEAGAGLWH